MPLKVIHTALSPNNTWRDTLAALSMLVLPWNWLSWRKGRAVEQLEAEFRELTGAPYALAVGSGREALYLILKSLNLKEGDEVIVQSFTCMVVINSILWNGLKPIYLDIDDTFNFTATELNKKITSKTKAVIVQHTFGIPAEIDKIKKVCQEKNLVLIEDCAHALGASVDGRVVGTFGDMSFYSLGRSKVISCVNGGIIICPNKKFQTSLEKVSRHLKTWPGRIIFQNLMHPIICSKAKLLYFSPLGKLTMLLAQKLKLINLEVTPGEKKAVQPNHFPVRLANAMARIALIQLKMLKKFNNHRREAASFYYRNLSVGQKINPAKFPGAIFLRYPLLIKNPAEVLKEAKKKGVILGDWYTVPVAPPDISSDKTGYEQGSCPNCEKINKQIINLPTHQSLNHRDMQQVVKLVNQYAKN